MSNENKPKCEGCLNCTCAQPEELYNVHLYPTVRVKVNEVPATDHEAAIEKARDMVDLNRLFRTENLRCLHGAADVEDGEELDTALVDEVGDEDYVNSKWYNLRPSSYCSPVPEWYGRFDDIGTYRCVEIYNAASDSRHTEQGYDWDDLDRYSHPDETITKRFFGVFGHLKTGGLESVCDCETEDDATAIAAALKGML